MRRALQNAVLWETAWTPDKINATRCCKKQWIVMGLEEGSQFGSQSGLCLILASRIKDSRTPGLYLWAREWTWTSPPSNENGNVTIYLSGFLWGLNINYVYNIFRAPYKTLPKYCWVSSKSIFTMMMWLLFQKRDPVCLVWFLNEGIPDIPQSYPWHVSVIQHCNYFYDTDNSVPQTFTERLFCSGLETWWRDKNQKKWGSP